jgi:hypothetical protein
MTPEERQVITAIFERLRAAENHPRDPEAERLIADLVARQPYAPYAMAQSIYVGEQALANMGRRVEELERALTEAKAQAEQAQQQHSGGFLSSLFGGGRQPEPQPPRGPGAAPSPWGQQPPQGYAQPPRGYAPGPQAYAPAGPMAAPQPGPWGGQPQGGGGGFLQSALTTAAGVAGGVVLGNMLSSAFSGHHGGGSGLGSYGVLSDPTDQGLGGQGFEAPGFSGRDISEGNIREAGGFDHDDAATRGGTDAAYDRSQDSHEDYASDHGGDDPGFSDDSGGGGDDSGWSGDV